MVITVTQVLLTQTINWVVFTSHFPLHQVHIVLVTLFSFAMLYTIANILD